MERMNSNRKELERITWDRVGWRMLVSQTLTWNPQGQRRSERTKNTLCREMEIDMRKMNKNWMELEKKAHDRVSWRLLVSGLCSIGEGVTGVSKLVTRQLTPLIRKIVNTELRIRFFFFFFFFFFDNCKVLIKIVNQSVVDQH
ncbi:unnamed protein product [Schistosoma curassoni]|uniref:Transmembrane protein n=1 Tax=Schistosoma curassoni TaxID=6186 RepID=A0A183JIK5_9TREM|nr:unnamed protein product [Schistosoma curassoni]